MTDAPKPETREAYAVVGNTDRTEGRGQQIVLHICRIPATAYRLAKGQGVMGTDAWVTRCDLVKHGTAWFGPITVVEPTMEDENTQERMDEEEAAIEEARNLGLTDAQIAAIRRSKS